MGTQSLTQILVNDLGDVDSSKYSMPGSLNTTEIYWMGIFDDDYNPFKKKDLPFGDLSIGKKTNKNTVIIKEQIGPIRNTYIHHDKGWGRETTDIKWDSPLRMPNYLDIFKK